MKGCVFCGIASGKIKAKIVYEDPCVVAFEDIKPASPVHIVVIPREHIERISDIGEGGAGRLVIAANKVAREKGVASSGYRMVINCNKDAGQEIFHAHLHLLGGRKFTWPPG